MAERGLGAALRRVGGDVHRAQDVTQLVFTALAHNAAALKRHPDLVGWLFTNEEDEQGMVGRRLF